MRNPLIETFFDDKLTLDYNIDFMIKDKKTTLNIAITFKKKITSFLFDKLRSYSRINILESEENYKKVSDFFEEIIQEIKLDRIAIEIDDPILGIDTFIFYLTLILNQINKDLDNLKKK